MVILALLEIGDRGIQEGERTSSGHACLVSPSRMRSDWQLRIYVHVFREATDTKGAKCPWPRIDQSTQRSSKLCFSCISLLMVCFAKYFRVKDECFSPDFNRLYFHNRLANLDDQAVSALPPYPHGQSTHPSLLRCWLER